MTHGKIGWVDLTVDDAETLKDFYGAVVGWKTEDVDMGGYSDFNMVAGDGQPAAGVCHARGSNAALPPQWMIYIVVPDVETSVARCTDLGGDVIVAPRGMAGGRYAVIRDPAGAVCALYQPPPQE